MYEKILQKLKDQRGSNNQVTDKTLEVKAKTLEKIITSEEILATVDFTDEITSMQGNIGFIASDAVKNAATEAEKKAAEAQTEAQKKEAAKKAAEEAEKKGDKPDMAKLISDALNPIVEEINGLKKQKALQTRQELLNEKIKDTPLIFKNTTLSNFKRMNFETDDEFNEYISETEQSAKEAIQIGNESGLKFATPSKEVHKPDPDAVSPEMEKAIDEITTKKEENKPF